MYKTVQQRKKIIEIEYGLSCSKVELHYLYLIDSDYVEPSDAVRPLRCWVRKFVLEPEFKYKVFERDDISFSDLFRILVPVRPTILPVDLKDVLSINGKRYKILGYHFTEELEVYL
jgi:hypothetical protein